MMSMRFCMDQCDDRRTLPAPRRAATEMGQSPFAHSPRRSLTTAEHQRPRSACSNYKTSNYLIPQSITFEKPKPSSSMADDGTITAPCISTANIPRGRPEPNTNAQRPTPHYEKPGELSPPRLSTNAELIAILVKCVHIFAIKRAWIKDGEVRSNIS
jgi:hypothetical protein